jgi:tryptophan synthase beta chain
VRDFQAVIGNESREQLLQAEGRLPDAAVACIGGGSNAMGMFYSFLADESVRLIGVEAAGLGLDSGQHAASICAGEVGILHGNKTFLLQDEAGQISNAHSVSAGLDYPGVGPEHSHLHEIRRAEYVSVTDEEALEGFKMLTELEGIIPALESAHAIAHVLKLAPTLPQDAIVAVCLSGRGDKDIHTVAEAMGVDL